MRVSIRVENYSDHKFISAFEPRFTKKKMLLKDGQIYFNDLLNLLEFAPGAKGYFNWNEVLQIKQFTAAKPAIEGLLTEPQKPQKPQEPIYDDLDPRLLTISQKPTYMNSEIKIQFLRKSLPKAAPFIERRIVDIGKVWHSYRLWRWERRLGEIEIVKRNSKKYEAYKREMENYNKDLTDYYKAHFVWRSKREEFEKNINKELLIWSAEKDEFDRSAKNEHELLIKLKSDYESKKQSAIERVIKAVLLRSPYPMTFPRHFEVSYDVESQIVIIDFQLPDFEKFEIVEDSKRLEFKPIAKNKRKLIVESAFPAIAIRTLYEVAITDEINAILSIVFNGWINFIDKKNGREKSECILSVHATVDEIKKLIINNVDPKECFKSLKGVIAKNILEYIPVAPILVMNKNDNRLIEGREVIEGLSPDDNLAAMDWNDFEHLIRELFEKEFSKSGAEVKITHASHDRGVDAIIYDPDPIRGGKFVIQAKRYTKLVDVSAVRDLYGTIQNENANRGILVTTSHYGPDAYEFAKNKNITLLTGENLLHLLEKHGYKFRIDIKEARKLLNLK
jgi:restriction system protein